MKNIYFPDFSCTHGHMCVYGRYAPEHAKYVDSLFVLYSRNYPGFIVTEHANLFDIA